MLVQLTVKGTYAQNVYRGIGVIGMTLILSFFFSFFWFIACIAHLRAKTLGLRCCTPDTASHLHQRWLAAVIWDSEIEKSSWATLDLINDF